ncbi:MAG: TetR/AcrR family transcriptional regulator [Candidatus Dormibacteraceae bacterium]
MTVNGQGRGYHHGDLKVALVDAVEQVVRQRGVGHVSLRAVARQVGVTHAASAHHFENKAGLLTAFASQGYVQLSGAVMASIDEAQPVDGPSVLEAVGRGYVRFALANPGRFEVMFRLDLLNADDPDLAAASEGAYSLLVSTIARCQAEGFLGTNDPEVVAVSAWSTVHGLAALWISGRLSERIREKDPNRLADRVSRLYVDSVLRAASPRAPRPGRRPATGPC